MVVPSCPNGHGVWLSNDIAQKIKHFFESHLSTPGHSRQQLNAFRVFAIIAGIALAVFNAYQRSENGITSRNENYKMSLTMKHTQRVGPHYWPSRDFSTWNAFPADQDAITDPAELAYLKQWMDIVNGGIINRMNMQDALLIKRPANEYLDAFYYYSDRQNAIINRLRALEPPERLGAFHDLVVDAAVSQVAFYEDYARRKADVPALEFSALMQHPKLVDCNAKLWDAFHEFERIYPNRDTATNSAIEQRLCWLDMI